MPCRSAAAAEERDETEVVVQPGLQVLADERAEDEDPQRPSTTLGIAASSSTSEPITLRAPRGASSLR